MTPTFFGRLQTRSFLALLVGVPVTLLMAGVLEGLTVGAGLAALLVFTLVGLVWEVGYDLLQQRRWDRDWPTLFALGTGLPEIFLAWPVLAATGLAPDGFGTHAVFFGTVWGATWVVQQGPISVLLPHWRHQGARVLPEGLVALGRSGDARPAPAAPRPERRLGLASPAAGDWLRLTRPRLLVLGACAFWGVGIVLLAPIVGNHDHDSHAHQEQSALDTRSVVSGDATTEAWNIRERVLPEHVEFRAIGMSSDLDKVLVTESGALGTPTPARAAWYRHGAAPGQRGPAILIGSTDAVFSELAEAREGQRLKVVREDGSQVRFVVDEVLSVDSTEFPTKRVYGRSGRPLLRMIGYDPESGHNVIVFAHAASMTMPPKEA